MSSPTSGQEIPQGNHTGVLQRQDFCLTDDDQQHPHEGQEGDVERAAERHTGDDEGDDEEEEADDHQSSDSFGPGCRKKQRQVNQRGKNGF